MQLTNQDIQLARQVLTTNLAQKPSESLLVVTDPQMAKVEGALWFKAGKTITSNTQIVAVKGMTANGQEPPENIALSMAQADVVILQTTFSLTHTAARRNANAQGARVASLPNADITLLRHTLSADYRPIQTLCTKLVTTFTGKNQVTLTNPSGTNLTLSIKGRSATADDGFLTQKGSFGNLPAGETMLAPLEGTTNGEYVVEGAFAPFPTDTPIRVIVRNGVATSISGGKAAEYINQTINNVGQKARNIGELGVGTNPKANPRGKVLEAEKAYGTVHLALGNNLSYGGVIDVSFHMDGVILSPTLSVDNQVIIKDGVFTL